MRLLILGPDQGWHADQMRSACARRGYSIQFCAYEHLQGELLPENWRALGITSVLSDATKDSHDSPQRHRPVLLDCDVILARTMPFGSLDQITFRLGVMHAIANSRAPIVNSPRTLEIAIDKYATLVTAVESGWTVPETIVCQNRSAALEAFEKLGGDVVVKPLLGSEGRGVLRLSDKQLAWTAFTTLDRLGAVIYVQRFIAPGGRDLRILVWGDRLFAVRRENPMDWRTNVSRGATTRVTALPSELESPIQNLIDRLELTYGALDIAEDADGRPYLLEVNAVPGWQGAESALDINLAQILIDSLAKKVPGTVLAK